MSSRLGFLSSAGLVVVGIAYAVVTAVGIVTFGLTDPILDPILAIMEILTLVAAPLLVVLMAAVYHGAAGEQRLFGLIALAFATLAAGLTSGVHFTSLTAGRQTGFVALEWPSTPYALELLAWDVFLGLSLLFAAPVFVGPGLRAKARWSLSITGGLCLAGTIGPVSGDMTLQRVGILGYGVVLPITCVILALLFRREMQMR
jgi:hypothetical protein